MMTTQAFSSAAFGYDKNTKVFSTFASDIHLQRFIRLYPDAADVGINIRSRKTGKIAAFYLNQTDRDADGDIRAWTLFPTHDSVRENPGLAGSRVIIFNT